LATIALPAKPFDRQLVGMLRANTSWSREQTYVSFALDEPDESIVVLLAARKEFIDAPSIQGVLAISHARFWSVGIEYDSFVFKEKSTAGYFRRTFEMLYPELMECRDNSSLTMCH
jgi:hypothetical protein